MDYVAGSSRRKRQGERLRPGWFTGAAAGWTDGPGAEALTAIIAGTLYASRRRAVAFVLIGHLLHAMAGGHSRCAVIAMLHHPGGGCVGCWSNFFMAFHHRGIHQALEQERQSQQQTWQRPGHAGIMVTSSNHRCRLYSPVTRTTCPRSNCHCDRIRFGLPVVGAETND